MPYIDKLEPKRIKLLRDSELPHSDKSSTLSSLPSKAIPNIDARLDARDDSLRLTALPKSDSWNSDNLDPSLHRPYSDALEPIRKM
jgi:hypothetical protein